jgi:hypothetical protein
MITPFGNHLFRSEFFIGVFVKNSRNPSAKAQDHEGPDQRKINNVRNDGIEASYKKHLSLIEVPKLVNSDAHCKQ